ncbi:MAG TPA: serine/threonine-protein kinase [Terriglobales bacterium]|jgi:serine/threonine protein kinase|nr:serine/threonine-protein kinase [Terriglobales bacterium]
MVVLALEQIARAICSGAGHTLEKPLGEGAFKEVFLVTTGAKELKALKILKPGLASERTDREVEAMTRCRHPNIASLETVATFKHSSVEYTYLVEEFIGGGTLDELLQKGTLPRSTVLTMGSALIEAVAHVASNDLVHRDIKPANILFRTTDQPVIVDFGLVRDLRKTSVTVTWATCGPCTPLYASPEQLTNDKAIIGWRSDQFSLGVVLAFSGLSMHPFARPGDDPAATVLRVEARQGPSAEFIEAARKAGLPVLERMVGNWPVERIRKPADLLKAWREQ